MPIQTLIVQIRQSPESIEFNDVISVINTHYDYNPVRFTNGIGDDVVINDAGKNEGSCRIFAFAKLNNLNENETLACFGKFYREDVLMNPNGNDHANIRTFMRHGWTGIHFEDNALATR